MANTWTGNDIIAEDGPFMFDKEHKGRYEICSAPWAYIDDLPAHILKLINCLSE